MKSKHLDINPNVNMAIDEEDKQENCFVVSGKLNPKEKVEKETRRTIKAQAKLGTVKIEKKDWFSSLKFS